MAGGRVETFTFYDAKQQSKRLQVHLDSTATLADNAADAEFLAVDLAALSNSSTVPVAGGVRAIGPYTSPAVPVSPGAVADYQTVLDKGVFVFQDASGQLHRYQVPVIKHGIFLADEETIDFTNSFVQQFVADMTFAAFGAKVPQTLHAVVSRSGVALTASVGGFRAMRKLIRKFNIFTRNPTLTGEGE